MKFKKSESLILKCVGPNGETYNGFTWPLSTPANVEAPNFDPAPTCGGGLHGWLWATGVSTGGGVWTDNDDARWMILAAPTKSIIDLVGKVKFPTARVLFVSPHPGPKGREECVGMIHPHAPSNTSCMWLRAIGGDNATLTAGNYATLTAGDCATLKGGDYATLKGGDYVTLKGGDYATLTGGNYATLTGGYAATLTAGGGSKFRGGEGTVFIARWWADGWKVCVGLVGESIAPHTWYQIVDGVFSPILGKVE